MNNINYQHHGDIGELNKHDKDLPFTKTHYKLTIYKDLFMSWSAWEGLIDIAYLKIEHQDQSPSNTL